MSWSEGAGVDRVEWRLCVSASGASPHSLGKIAHFCAVFLKNRDPLVLHVLSALAIFSEKSSVFTCVWPSDQIVAPPMRLCF